MNPEEEEFWNEVGIRNMYSSLGVTQFYKKYGDYYRNPHQLAIQDLVKESLKFRPSSDLPILDLCCGSGEVSNSLLSAGISKKLIEASDPYTNKAFKKSTGLKSHKWSFLDIVKNGLPRMYSSIYCSYALHLCPEDLIPILLFRIAENCQQFIIISPSNKTAPKNNPFFKEIYQFKGSRRGEKGIHLFIFESLLTK
jgi:ubiquinone/menaquinone biosynthesis C-methylase UbiE